MQTLVYNLNQAWSDRAERALDHVDEAVRAPGLFKPDDVEATMTEAKRAAGQARYWQGQQ